jgi:L-fuculose-phosphate aldolase
VSTNSNDEQKLRKLMCKVGKLMRRYGYIDGTSGNLSARLGPDRILITPSGLAKGFMKPDQLIVINMAGQKVGPESEANRGLQPTSETAMHLECFRLRPDVGGVVHAHPPTAIALTIAGISLEQCVVPEIVVLMGLVPTTPYATPASDEDREAIQELIPQHDVLMLSHHGSLTVAADLWTAYLRLETLEHYANILFRAQQLGGLRQLAPDQIKKLLKQREALGLTRPHDEALFRKYFEVSL